MSIFSTAFFCGCQNPDQYKPKIISQSRPPLKIENRTYTAGLSYQKRLINCTIFGSGPDVTMIFAAIHGNERAGIPLLASLDDYLRNDPNLLNDRKVILIPIINPDGVACDKRFNANDVDLNRNFQADNRINNDVNGRQPLSEPESRILKRLIELYEPDKIIALHEPLNCIDYDGPAQHLAEYMGKFCDLPVKKLGARPGSLGSYAGNTLEIPIITVEFTPEDSKLTPDQLWQKYSKMLIAAIHFRTTDKQK